ncbi:MAG: aldehyde dehydrogenase family protein [Spirochaetaceae bacterium]|jgi:succinate-semialdehyde dehydrogenase/glutarate-semialdehyde dehydrogenase|nr:aldehyde dehydrogenase family protein [Spirochaetaceae bacterium]
MPQNDFCESETGPRYTRPGLSGAELSGAVAAARQAQALWVELPYTERARRLKKAGRFLAERVDDLTGLIHRENGKLSLDALATEILPAVMALDYYVKRGKKLIASRPVRGGNLLMFNKRSRLVYRPWGVVGIISPWNYPFAIPFSELVMALLAGNGVVLKVASDTPEVGRALAAVFTAADLPPGLFAHMEMPGREAGPAFIAAGLDKLFFTGSTAVGRELLALAAPRLLPLVLELGGADAAIIRADADLDRAAAGILWSGFSNAGQSCGGAQRILVHRTVYEPFLAKLGALVRALRPGNGPDADLGPMISVRRRREVEEQVEACRALGAVIAAQSPGYDGGGPGDADGGRFHPAMVLTQVSPDMPVMTDEIFGPVVAVLPVGDDEEALGIANNSPYSLTASVWSRDHSRAKKLAARINAGAVMINDHLMSHGLAETPWGGFGSSGIGKTHGEPGFREMLKVQVVVNDILPGVKRNLWWQPYSQSLYRGLRAITDLLAGPSPLRRLKAIPRVLKLFFRYWER